MAETPSHAMIVGKDGIPTGVVDIDAIQSAATILMYQHAAVAGDDDAVDRVVRDFMSGRNADDIGYICAATMSLMTRHVVAPMLDVLDRLAPDLDFRSKLAEARDHALETLG